MNSLLQLLQLNELMPIYEEYSREQSFMDPLDSICMLAIFYTFYLNAWSMDILYSINMNEWELYYYIIANICMQM